MKEAEIEFDKDEKGGIGFQTKSEKDITKVGNANQFSLININSVHTHTLGRCGYCSKTKWMTSGFDCESMALQDYQVLLDRGWRRCGTYYYKSHVDFCCCRAYAIRLNGKEYKPGKSQKKVLRKFQKMLEGDKMFFHESERRKDSEDSILSWHQECIRSKTRNADELIKHDGILVSGNQINSQSEFTYDNQCKNCNSSEQKLAAKDTSEERSNYMNKEQEIQAVINLIRESALEAMVYLILGIKESINEFLLILLDGNYERKEESRVALVVNEKVWQESRLFENQNKSKQGVFSSNILLTFFRINIAVWEDSLKEKFRFFAKFTVYFNKLIASVNQRMLEKSLELRFHKNGQIKIYYLNVSVLDCLYSEKRKIISEQRESILSFNAHDQSLLQGNSPSLTVSTEASIPHLSVLPTASFVNPVATKEKYVRVICKAEFNEESFELYKRYNQVIHNNVKTSKESYKNFLCLNGLKTHVGKTEGGSNGKCLEYGCFHFKYYLDTTLVAVSVVDVLPGGLSSVYYFYEPKLKKYSLGVIGNLKDIEFIKDMNASFPQFQQYYLGLYIHNNTKMSYKASHKPFELLCPSTYRWVSFVKSSDMSVFDVTGGSPRLWKESDGSNLSEEASQKNGRDVIEDMRFEGIDMGKYVSQKIRFCISGRNVKITQIKQSFITYFCFLLEKLATLIGKQLSESFVFGQK